MRESTQSLTLKLQFSLKNTFALLSLLFLFLSSHNNFTTKFPEPPPEVDNNFQISTTNENGKNSLTLDSNFRPTLATICNGVFLTATQIGGTVFEDWDFDGIINQKDTIGIEDIKIYVYDCDGILQDSSLTDASGNYLVDGLTGTAYRIEFSIPDNISAWAKPTQAGANNGTTTQFVAPGNCASLGLAQPDDYCQANPQMIMPCYDAGITTGTNMNAPALVSVDYDLSTKTPTATFGETGATWGIGYQRSSQYVFAASFLKRNTGLSKGLGHIHLQTASGYLGSFDLQGVNGIDVGTVDRSSGPDFTLGDGAYAVDLDGFAKVGTVGFGDIDIYNENTLTLVNLNSKSLINIDISNATALPTNGAPIASSLVTEYTLSFPDACPSGEMRPFGLKYHKGKGYLGVVCDASISLDSSDLHAYVYQFDPINIGGGLTLVIDFALDYTRETDGPHATVPTSVGSWRPWVSDWTDLHRWHRPDKWFVQNAAPILSDIEFVEDGSMILGLMDRTANQIGSAEPIPTPSPNPYSPTTAVTWSAGDILKVCYVNGNYVMEGSGGCAVNDVSKLLGGYSHIDGPSAIGEFFWGDTYIGETIGHFETTTGSLAYRKGNQQVVSTAFDIDGYGQPGGILKLSNLSGIKMDSFLVTPKGASAFRKNIGLGDIELLCDAPPIEIGNYVWIDENKNGLQDASEPGVDSLIMRLYDANCNLVAIDTTLNGGQYYFNQFNVDTTGVGATGVPNTGFSGLAPQATYYVVLGKDGEWNTTTNQITIKNAFYDLTLINQGNNDLIDNDAAVGIACGLTNNAPFIAVTTGTAGSMNHGLDFGLSQGLTLGNLVWEDLNNNGIADVGEPGIDSIELKLFSVGPDKVKGGNDDILIDSTFTDSSGLYRFSSLDEGTYYVKIVRGIPTNMVSSTGTGFDGNGSSTFEPGAMTDANVNNDDDGTQMVMADGTLMIMSDTVQLSGLDEPTNDGDMDNYSNLSVDFGLIRLLSLGNLVWEDANNDGFFNNDEKGVDSVQVILYQVGADDMKATPDDLGIDTLLTDVNGIYLFDSLAPGEYFVKLNSGIPTGMISATAKSNDTLNTEPAIDPDSNDWDNDDNGTQMGTMIMSDLVSLSLSDEPINDGDVDSTSNLAVDFGLFVPLSIGNLVWEDLDNDGLAETGEPGIENVELLLFDVGSDGVKGGNDDIEVARDTTDANGKYLFDTLPAATYYVKINSSIPMNMLSSTGSGADGLDTTAFEPGALTDNNINNNDDGTQMVSNDTLMIMSDTINLSNYAEPTNDEDADNNTNLSVDFGLIRYLSIGDLVWTDSNNDGLFNNVETGLNDIEVLLYQVGVDSLKGTTDDVLIDSMITINDGKYLFDSLSPGEYFIKLNNLDPSIISATGEGLSTITGTGNFEPATDPDTNANNNDDNGTQMGNMVMSELVQLSLSEEPTNDGDQDSTSNLSVDFGLFQTLSIGNLVWEDLNNNGNVDTNETGIANLELILFEVGPDGIKGGNNDVEIKRDTTDINGNYLFDLLAEGTYYVKINSGIPSNMVSATGAGIDGSQDADFEPGAMTDSNIDNDDDGTQMAMPNGSLMIMSDTINLAYNDEPINDADSDNNTNLSVDFGLYQTLSLGNLVWEDLDNDGLADSDEPRLKNMILTLFKDGGDNTKMSADDINLGNDTTDVNGQYLFENLQPGEYFIKINDLPFGYISSTGEGISSTSNAGPFEPAPDADVNTNHLDDGIYMDSMIMSSLVSLHLYDEPINDEDTDSSTNLTVDFGLFQTLVLGNLVWEDLNNNGTVDTDEPGMEGIETILFQPGPDGMKGTLDDIEISIDTTDANGNYMFFNLDAGMYYVKLNSGIPAGYRSATGEGSTSISGTGTYEPAPDPDIYVDHDDNGTQMDMPDGSIMVMSDLVHLELYAEQTDSVINQDVDFGLYSTLELGNLVWNDINNNGTVDIDEPGIEGVEVILYQTTDATKGNLDDLEIARDTTDINGHYLFPTLQPGDYWVKLNKGIPNGYRSSTGEGISKVTGSGIYETAADPDNDVNDNDDGTQMIAGNSIMVMSEIISLSLYEEPDNNGIVDKTANYTVDFGLYETLDLGNLVWEDLDNDGIATSGEPGIEGVEVVLFQPGPDGIKGNVDDIEIARDTTDNNGKYIFENLNPGDYFVKLNDGIPANFFSSTGEGNSIADGTGPNEPAADPDNDTNNTDDGTEIGSGTNYMIMSDLISLALNDEPTDDEDTDANTNFSVDFGLFESMALGNLVWKDLDNDGFADSNEPGIGGIEVILFQPGPDGIKGNVDDIEIARDTTDTNGGYGFQKLYPNEYYVKLNNGIPNGFYSSTGEGATSATGIGPNEPAADPDATNTNGDDDGTMMIMNDGAIMVMSDLISMVLYDEPTDDGDTNENTNYAIDFGLFEGLDLGNQVWEDLDNDGEFDTDEEGIVNIEMMLCQVGSDGQKNTEDDVEIARDTTDFNGLYLFEDLLPGDYFIKLTDGIPPGLISSTGEGIFHTTTNGPAEPPADADNNVDHVDDGSQMGTIIMSDLVSLVLYEEPIDDNDTDNTTNTSVDFGLYQKLILGGTVWEDESNGGQIGPNPIGMNNIEVILFKPGLDGLVGTADDIQIDQTTTDINGDYQFEDLMACDYFVKLNNTPTSLGSSDGNGFGAYVGAGPNEPGSPSENGIDGDDNGSQMSPTMIVSDIIDMDLYSEPIDDADDLNYTNTTIDFGLTPLNYAKIYDPCGCLNNESAPGAGDGQFADRVIILSTLPNETWSLVYNSGVYTTSSPIPPSTPIVMPLGTTVVPNGREDGYFSYFIDLRHINAQGYTAVFSNGSNELSVSNYCTYVGNCEEAINDDPSSTPSGIPPGQVLVIGTSDNPMVDSLNVCDDNNSFTDDGLVDGLYIDTTARDNRFTICPPNQWQNLQFNFSEFSTAPGDILYVYDGKNTGAPLLGRYEGEGVSQTGGWVAASCQPSINPSGCLTFRFVTNGDNRKGNGWDGNFECQERNLSITPPNNLTDLLICKEVATNFTILPATVKADCGVVQDSQIIRIYNAHDKLCKDTCLAFDESFSLPFAIGAFRVEYKLKTDTTKTTEAVLSVQAPSLVCNDNVTIPLGSGCAIALFPDDLLENPCDTITDTMYYYISIIGIDKNGKEKVLATGGGKGGNYPFVEKEMIAQCGGTLKATIERRFFEGLTPNICNSGMQYAACTTTVNVVDQSAPIFHAFSKIDTFKVCLDDLTPESLGIKPPQAIDNCDSVDVKFAGINTLIDEGVCGTTQAQITWIATDACGNSSSVKQAIVILRPDPADLVPVPDVLLSCGEDGATTIDDFAKTGMPGIKIGKVENGVLIPFDTLALTTTDYVCGYILQKRDIQLAADCGIKVFRYWEMLNWCNPDVGVLPLDTQYIELKDTIAPNFLDNYLNTKVLALHHHACTFDITKLDKPNATDNCAAVDVRMDKVFRIEDGSEWEIPAKQFTALDCDSFLVRWVAEDACHEQIIDDTLTQIILIKDQTKPAAVCADQINLSLGLEYATLHYSDIDGGSSDACGIDKYEVSRDKVNWDSVVTFHCEDVHEPVTVYLRITDKKGNQSTCWMTVNVEDKIAPICSELPDQIGTCDEAHIALLGTATDANENGLLDDEWVDMTDEQVELFNEKYGNPNCSDNTACNNILIQQQYQLVEKKCGIIHIKRRYRAIDWHGKGRVSNWEEQDINIEPKPDWSITLPADWIGACGDDIPVAELLITNGACDLMAYEVEEKTFTTVEDACLKVVRTYTIINWCNYEADRETIRISREENQLGMVTYSKTLNPTTIGEDLASVGKLEYIQILKIKDDTAPKITISEVDNCIEGADCQAIKQFAITAIDCNSASTTALSYNWTISANDIQLASGEGAFFDYPVAAKVTYDLKWMVSDACGNIAWEEVSYEFWDCKKPVPYCLHGVAVELMPDIGMIQVWATDLQRNSSDNCTPKEQLDYRIWHTSLGTEPTDFQGVQQLPQLITFDCTYLGTQPVNLYVIDEEGNWDFCRTYVNIQDNMGACENISTLGNMAAVSGTILDWKQNAVEEVMVKTTTNSSVDARGILTKENGAFQFHLESGNSYTIQPEKDIRPLNGVSTYDLVLISKHILGITKFDNPYQYIAADVNKSGTITAFDMVQLRQLILTITTDFKDNASWRFVNAVHQFKTENPAAEIFPEAVQVNDLRTDMQIDFVAIKIGDVNGNARPNRLAKAEDRTISKSLEITAEDQYMKAGETYIVSFTSQQIDQIQGYQFSLAFDNLKLEKLHKGVAGVEHFGLHQIEQGLISTSWNQHLDITSNPATQQPSNPVTTLFTLEFTALKDGNLSDQLFILDRPTAVEAYDLDGKLMDIQLAFTNPIFEDAFELFQNQPNPFHGKTTIGFYLPGDSDIHLILRDETGRVLKSLKDNRKAGYNTILLNKEDLTNGFIYYQLSTKFGTQAKTMIQLK